MTENLPQPQSDILIYQTEDGRTRIDVRLENETVWLSQAAMVELYQTTKQNISLHIRNIIHEGELNEAAVVKQYLTTAADAKSYRVKHYNLDMILAVGYRVRSHRGVQFRRWATERLREYLARAGGPVWKLYSPVVDPKSMDRIAPVMGRASSEAR